MLKTIANRMKMIKREVNKTMEETRNAWLLSLESIFRTR